MVVVIAVIVILLALVVPAATQMWNQRAVSDAENTISGLLMTTRAKALQGDMGEVGLFFFVDQKGTQQIATIAKSPLDPDRAPPDPTAASDTVDGQISKWRQREFWRDIYTVIGQPRAMPSSMRVVPRKAMQWTDDPFSTLLQIESFSRPEAAPPSPFDRHRNFFVAIYNTRGEFSDINPWAPPLNNDPDPAKGPRPGNVLIRDRDDDQNGTGDLTGLKVSDTTAQPTGFYDTGKDGSKRQFKDEFQFATNDLVPYGLIVDPEDANTAMSFRTVDGLLVYDDALLREAGTDPRARLTVLQNTAQPFYVSRLTGAIVKGPQGESNPQ